MTDMPEWRAWADAAHAESLQPLRRKRERRRGHFPCPDCPGTDFKRFGLLESHRAKSHPKPKP
jgi:hypothetical protein